MDYYINAFMRGPILPKEVPQEEYDKVMSYLKATGFIKMVLEEVRQEERERAKKIIEEEFPDEVFMTPDQSFSLGYHKRFAFKKLNGTV